jgi:dihydroorotate dehydrogenase (NAD+) catalytic subunit
MLNSIGLENDGVGSFIEEKMPFVRKIDIPAIISIGGEKAEDFVYLAECLGGVQGVSGIEINISCPNLTSHKSRLFSQDAKATHGLVKSVRKATKLTLITKLTPNVTDITEIAKAAEAAGSDAVSLVNTYMGMAVDIDTKRPRLGNVTGGLSGPAIKPLALKAVWDVYNSVDIPIIGMGGIAGVCDIIEFILCGAAAVSLGTANFVDPAMCVDAVTGIADHLKKKKIASIKDLTGSLEV